MQIINKESEEFPKSLLQIENCPKQIYVKGDSSLLKKDSIAIVGTRKYSEYGKKCTQTFASRTGKRKY